MTKPRGFINRPSAEGCGLWTEGEHQRFLEALRVYPNGPWKLVSEYVGTRNVRQTMTHAQKYKQKLARHERGLRTRRRKHDTDSDADSPRTGFAVATPVAEDSALQLTASFADLMQPQVECAAVLAAPLALLDDDFDAMEHTVLATPVVADCIDYLVRSFA